MYSRYGRNAVSRVYLAISLVTAFASGSALADYSASEFTRVTTPQESRVNELRDREVQQLQLVLSRSGMRDQEPEMLLRLAELYTEKYRFFFYKETEVWNQRMDAAMQAGGKPRRERIDNGASKKWLLKAVGVLEHIPQQRLKFDRIDEVYYFLGFNYWELGRKRDAVRYFEKIADNHPKGRFASEAYRYLGEYAFSQRNFPQAVRHYRTAAGFKGSPARARVLYGLGWSYFKTKDYKQASSSMTEAIRESRNNGAEAERLGVGLQKDAADALALFFAEAGDAKRAGEYFTEVFGNQAAADTLRKLAAIYQRQGKYGKALEINRQLVNMGGATADAGAQEKYNIMLDSLRVAGAKSDRNKEAALLKTIVGEFVLNAKDPDEARVEQIRQMVRKAALLAHQEGNKSKNSKSAFLRAESLYRLYLSAFAAQAKPADVNEINYLLADALSQMGRHREAAAQFRTLLDASLSSSGDASLRKYQKDCALGLIYSLDAYFKENNSGDKVSGKDADELISAIDAYVRIYPSDKDVTKYMGRAAGLLVKAKRMDEARPRLIDLVERYPATKDALDAAVVLIRDSEERKDYQDAVQISQKMLANTALMAQDKDGKVRSQLQSIISRAKFKEVKDVEDNQNFGEAAKKYETLAAQAGDKEVRFKALNNAAVNYAKAGDKVNELRLYQQIALSYPTYEQAGKNILAAANEHFLLGRYAEAAQVFELYYKVQEEKVKRKQKLGSREIDSAVDAIRTASLIREAMGNRQAAAEDHKKIVEAANEGVAAARSAAEEILYQAASRQREANAAPADVIRAYQRYLNAFSTGRYAAEATLQVGMLYAQLREEEKAQNHYNTVLAKVKAKGAKASPEELGYAAQARMLLLAGLEESFHKAPLRLPESRLKTDIQAKLQAMERLNKGYIEVVEFGDGAWGVEAFQRMAAAYRAFAEDLESAPVPAEYSPEDKAKFKTQLKAVAQPVYAKVGETLESALRKGEQLAVAGPAMARAYLAAALNSARSDRLPLIQETDWSNTAEWLAGETPSDAEIEAKREALKNKQEDSQLWIAVGNWHAHRGEWALAKIFFQKAAEKNARSAVAVNNLAFLEGRTGKSQRALNGFKAALGLDEFALVPKRNLARLYMSSGLWRHANLAYRQLDVRQANDADIKRGLALSYLAQGKWQMAEPALKDFGGGGAVNERFARAILYMAKNDMDSARSAISDLAGRSEYAAMIQKAWGK